MRRGDSDRRVVDLVEGSGTDDDRAMLEVRHLSVGYKTSGRLGLAIDDVSFTLPKGKVLGIVGESGSGKSATARAVIGLLPGQAIVTAGEIRWNGVDLRGLDDAGMRAVRGAQVAMVFQDPLSSLNPVLTIGTQLTESLRQRKGLDRRSAEDEAVRLLDDVRIPQGRELLKRYPHQLSGGMRQRVLIAIALSLDPDLLIADEPTTALDVTIQAEVMALLQELKTRRAMSMILISHDLGAVAGIADYLAVMYAGRLVELGKTEDVYKDPIHPYTRALLRSKPSIFERGAELAAIEGSPPTLVDRPSGCVFHPRCPIGVLEACRTDTPALVLVGSDRSAACHRSSYVISTRRGGTDE